MIRGAAQRSMKQVKKQQRLTRAGFVEANQDDTNSEVAGARWQFIQAVRRVVPAFFDCLRDQVYPAYVQLAKGKPDYWQAGWKFETWKWHSDGDNRLTPLLTAWAQAFNVADETWILEGALQTLANWLDHPGWRNAVDIHGFRPSVCVSTLITEEEHHFKFEDLGWDPQFSTLENWRTDVQMSFKEAVNAHVMRVRRLIEDHGVVPTASHFTAEHFKWLARYQCGGQTLESILTTARHVADKTTISKGLHRAARLAKLSVRPKRRKLKSS